MDKQKVVSESEITTRLLNGESEMLDITKLLGYDRLMVQCLGRPTRVCKIQGKTKWRTWTRINDVVLVSPWDFQSDTRGDITYHYKRNQADPLQNNGYRNTFSKFLGAS